MNTELNEIYDITEEQIRQEMTWSDLEILRGSRNSLFSMKENDYRNLRQLMKEGKLYEAIQFANLFEDSLADYYKACCYYASGSLSKAYSILVHNKCNHPKRISLTKYIEKVLWI